MALVLLVLVTAVRAAVVPGPRDLIILVGRVVPGVLVLLLL